VLAAVAVVGLEGKLAEVAYFVYSPEVLLFGPLLQLLSGNKLLLLPHAVGNHLRSAAGCEAWKEAIQGAAGKAQHIREGRVSVSWHAEQDMVPIMHGICVWKTGWCLPPPDPATGLWLAIAAALAAAAAVAKIMSYYAVILWFVMRLWTSSIKWSMWRWRSIVIRIGRSRGRNCPEEYTWNPSCTRWSQERFQRHVRNENEWVAPHLGLQRLTGPRMASAQPLQDQILAHTVYYTTSKCPIKNDVTQLAACWVSVQQQPNIWGCTHACDELSLHCRNLALEF